ncbi:YARHG domain-containing protein [Sellimonas intestinalis]|uniref:YARHG domain-containing protein n=1 Tax=Sellimonas intestinalis TaxID=1653434 RepID=UPI0015ECB229|nr:YARHG domain-containing protein [Sellimonas intestinalis]MBA2214180.1 YARHG domain-containing protein [Sellimonas intestinalis]
MKCKKCGKELEPDWKICPGCGEPTGEKNESKELTKKKKPLYKRIWFWILVVFVGFIGLAVYGSSLPEKDTEQKAAEEKVADFSEYDFKELLSQPESAAKSIGLEQKEESIYTGLEDCVQVVYEEDAVQTIQIKGDETTTPSFCGVRIGMEKAEADEKLKESYPEKTEAESEQTFMNLDAKESVICSIADGKVNAITFQKLSDEEVAEYQKVKEEQLRAQYIFPDSDKKYLSEDEVRSVEVDKLAIGRNEIFARHGYIFDDDTYKQYFESMPWYTGTVPADQFNADAVFNDFEKKNVELIKRVEDEVNGVNQQEAFIGKEGAYVCVDSGGFTGRIEIYKVGNSYSFALDTLEMTYDLITGTAEVIDSNTLQITSYGLTITCTWSDSEHMYVTSSGEIGGTDAAPMEDSVRNKNYIYSVEFS